jgi:SAM-dependent methyltransferase
VYDNEVNGISPLGKWIDRGYLNAVGWEGIRTRRLHLRELLQSAINEQKIQHDTVHILDVATGCGRYVLDVLESESSENLHARLRDWTPENLQQGEANAKMLGVDNVVFEQADAFNPKSYQTLSPKPTIVIVSGLYELFPENEPLRKSLAAIADCLEPGGYLIYTCQPWHPQVEMIARTLVNREGEPWIMRRRTQAEMDELVQETGLKKVDMRIDTHGIFTVSVARK